MRNSYFTVCLVLLLLFFSGCVVSETAGLTVRERQRRLQMRAKEDGGVVGVHGWYVLMGDSYEY